MKTRKNSKNNFKKTINEIIKYVIHNIPNQNIDKKIIDTTKNILLANVNDNIFREYVKFDFSFTLHKKNDFVSNLRFTWNNYGEKDFDKKIIDIFRVFNKNYSYDIESLKNIFDNINVNSSHQATFGIDWPYNSDAPRLKLYLEELHLKNNLWQRKNKLKNKLKIISHILDIGHNYRITNDNIGVIGIDFFSNTTCALKVYYYEKVIPRVFSASIFELLKREKSAFYFIVDRIGCNRSDKILKIYENYITDFKDSYAEIGDMITFFNLKKYVFIIEELFNICRKNNFLMFPSIVGIDYLLDVKKVDKADIYFSIK